MKKILILMSDTGGGHRASAEALQAAFQERHPDTLQVDMVDLWLDHTPPPLNQVPKGYRFLVDDVPWLYKLLYRVGEQPLAIEPLLRTASRLLSRPIGQVIRKHDPDLIVSVHPLMQEVPLRILRRLKRNTPFVTVITDLISVHPVWYRKDVTLCFVPSQTAYRLGLRAGLRPEQLRLRGLPIRPAFGRKPRPKAEVRQELGLLPDVPMLLMIGGGEGMGRMGETASAIAERLAADGQGQAGPLAQLVVVCGSNQRLEEELTQRTWPIPLLAKGYIPNIWDWMAACDCIITKAGPGTVAESMALGLPMVLSGFVPGQESANVPYVLRHGAGVYLEDPLMLAELLSGWLGPERDVMAQFAERSRLEGRPQATFQIVDEIAELLSL
jgi:1,2-diacylglycerol 3-beta-galactosyltransferase